MPARVLSPDQEAEVCALYRGGDGIAPLARQFRVGEETVRRILDREGVDRRSKGRPQKYPERAKHFDPRRASILHLVDLKRAGHSPRWTELTVTPDALAGSSPFRPSLIHSGPGSSAAMCAEQMPW